MDNHRDTEPQNEPMLGLVKWLAKQKHGGSILMFAIVTLAVLVATLGSIVVRSGLWIVGNVVLALSVALLGVFFVLAVRYAK
jgi:hypothetical protein